MKNLLFALSLLAASTAPAQTVTRLAATKANDYGLTYSLPRTVVNITLQARCVVEKPGEFYNYAERYLGAAAAANAVKAPSTRWSLIAAEMTPGSEVPSGAETYLMQFKSGNPVYVLVGKDGNPLAINTDQVQNQAVKPSKLAASPLTASPLDGQAARYAVTEDMLAGTSTARRARMAADQIMQLRQSRQDYLTGQAETMPDGKALEMILQNINAQEEALTAMFLGTVQERTDVTTVTYVPDAENSESDVVIARINAAKGFVGPDDLTGMPVYLQYEITDRGTLPLNEKGEKKAFPKGGVPYCIPGAADIRIEYDGSTVAGAGFSVAQLGVVFGLDPSFFTNKKEPGYATFNPLTGAITQMGTKSNH